GGGNYPLLLRNGPTFDICQGIVVQGDVYIPTSGSTPTGADATMVLAYNVSAGVTQAYMLAISLDPGPANFFLQKNNGASVTNPPLGTSASLPSPIVSGTWFPLKGQITQSAPNLVITGKVWKKGTTEPVAWAFTFTDTTPFPCGQTWQQGWQSDATAD